MGIRYCGALGLIETLVESAAPDQSGPPTSEWAPHIRVGLPHHSKQQVCASCFGERSVLAAML